MRSLTTRRTIERAAVTFATMAEALASTLPPYVKWSILGADGQPAVGGQVGAVAAVPSVLNSGLYVPFSAMADGGYGYSIDSGASLITEDADGLLVEMTPSTSWEITLTGLAPTDGAHFLLQALHLWLTISAPVAPVGGDSVWIKHTRPGVGYWSAGVVFWLGVITVRIRTYLVSSGVTTDVTTAVYKASTVGERVLSLSAGAQGSSSGASSAEMKAVVLTQLATGVNVLSASAGVANAVSDITDGAAFITTIGGSVGAGASWTVRLHGLRGVEHVVNTVGAPF